MFCGLDLLYIMKLSLDHLTWAVGWPPKNQNNIGTSSTPVETLLATVTFFNYWFQPLNRGVRYKCRFQEYIQHYKAHKSSSLSWRWFLLTNNAQKRTFEKGVGNDRHVPSFWEWTQAGYCTLLSITIKMEHARMTTVESYRKQSSWRYLLRWPVAKGHVHFAKPTHPPPFGTNTSPLLPNLEITDRYPCFPKWLCPPEPGSPQVMTDPSALNAANEPRAPWRLAWILVLFGKAQLESRYTPEV